MRVQRTSRRIIRALDPIYDLLEPLTYPMIRFVAGVMMIPHGYGKVFGGIEGTTKFFASAGLEPAFLLAWYVGLLELIGGICVAFGFLTRLMSVQLVGLLAVATFYIHLPSGFLWVKGGYEYPLFWMIVMIAITIQGGAKLSIDNLMSKEF
ncbi:MAG: DoxX family protein [Proteobacteria bacterium]|jgi:putative oxidoreductase|nr:DoxX family protein [Pseudomonadota bacterium]